MFRAENQRASFGWGGGNFSRRGTVSESFDRKIYFAFGCAHGDHWFPEPHIKHHLAKPVTSTLDFLYQPLFSKRKNSPPRSRQNHWWFENYRNAKMAFKTTDILIFFFGGKKLTVLWWTFFHLHGLRTRNNSAIQERSWQELTRTKSGGGISWREKTHLLDVQNLFKLLWCFTHAKKFNFFCTDGFFHDTGHLTLAWGGNIWW